MNYGFIELKHIIEKAEKICDCIGHGKNGTAVEMIVETAIAETGLGAIEDKTVGAGMGMMMPGMIQGAMNQQTNQGGAGGLTIACPKCNTQNPQGAKFCSSCGTSLIQIDCPFCKAKNPPEAKFCISCGKNISSIKCPKCNTENQAGTKFCSNCGSELS